MAPLHNKDTWLHHCDRCWVQRSRLFWLQKMLFKICFVNFACCLASASKCILHSRASASNDRSLLAPFPLNVNPFGHTFWSLVVFPSLFFIFLNLSERKMSLNKSDFSMLGPTRHRFISLPCFLHPISQNTRTWPLAPPTKAGCRLHRDLPWTWSGNLPQAT